MDQKYCILSHKDNDEQFWFINKFYILTNHKPRPMIKKAADDFSSHLFASKKLVFFTFQKWYKMFKNNPVVILWPEKMNNQSCMTFLGQKASRNNLVYISQISPLILH